MTISRRHHYIPRFLIDKFSEDGNKVWVYNKEEDRILKSKQSSKSVFFEIGRNNFDLNGQTVDNIELMYSKVDNLLSKNLDIDLFASEIRALLSLRREIQAYYRSHT